MTGYADHSKFQALSRLERAEKNTYDAYMLGNLDLPDYVSATETLDQAKQQAKQGNPSIINAVNTTPNQSNLLILLATLVQMPAAPTTQPLANKNAREFASQFPSTPRTKPVDPSIAFAKQFPSVPKTKPTANTTKAANNLHQLAERLNKAYEAGKVSNYTYQHCRILLEYCAGRVNSSPKMNQIAERSKSLKEFADQMKPYRSMAAVQQKSSGILPLPKMNQKPQWVQRKHQHEQTLRKLQQKNEQVKQVGRFFGLFASKKSTHAEKLKSHHHHRFIPR